MKRPCFSSKQSMSAATSYTTALGCTRIALIPSVLQAASSRASRAARRHQTRNIRQGRTPITAVNTLRHPRSSTNHHWTQSQKWPHHHPPHGCSTTAGARQQCAVPARDPWEHVRPSICAGRVASGGRLQGVARAVAPAAQRNASMRAQMCPDAAG